METDWFWLVLVGVSAMTAHYTLTKALSLAEATLVVPMEFLRLPLIAVVGYLFYGEAMELWVGLGAVLIFGGIFINMRQSSKGP